MHHLTQGGVSRHVLETIVQHGDPADVLCNKDPLAMENIFQKYNQELEGGQLCPQHSAL